MSISSSASDESKKWVCSSQIHKKHKGVRRRKWGKWVSEIRVPGSSERLWLGSYANPEAAAVAHDVALYCLRGNSPPVGNFNFPSMLPANVRMGMSPAEVQKAASDAGLAIDARYLMMNSKNNTESWSSRQQDDDNEFKGQNDHDWESTNNHESWDDWSRRTEEQQKLSISVYDYNLQ